MKRIKKNGLNERVPVRENNDELAKLSFLFNEMMDEVETSLHNRNSLSKTHLMN